MAEFTVIGSASNAAGTSASNEAVVGIDGSALGFGSPSASPAAGIGEPIGDCYPTFLTEGHHVGSIFGLTSSGTVSFSAKLVGSVVN